MSKVLFKIKSSKSGDSTVTTVKGKEVDLLYALAKSFQQSPKTRELVEKALGVLNQFNSQNVSDGNEKK
jgi:hypothetical protein